MAVLHIINKSPFQMNSLDSCLRLAKAGAAILLIEDAIYAAQINTGISAKIEAAIAKHNVYVLTPDIDARGINTEQLIRGVGLVGYDGFVKLTTEYAGVQSWL
jgi:tRNA 2-thiouridine synthesizing protein B